MFSTCLFCHAELGANESIEHFPVGKRLAFDSEKGRLWAVCPKCARWNLTPLGERWEALDECERAYRESRMRVSTDNIALARLRDGTDLVRIGRPLLPELATWRYGSQLRSRRRAYIATSGAIATIGFGAMAVASLSVPLVIGVSGVIGAVGKFTFDSYDRYQRQRAVGWLPAPLGYRHEFGTEHADTARISMSAEGVLSLSMYYRVLGPKGSFLREDRQLQLTGHDATELLAKVIVHVNRSGASRNEVSEAVREIERHHTAAEMLAHVAHSDWFHPTEQVGRVTLLPPPLRLGMEIALHQEDERRAMAGELGALYARWEEAERIARIADGELTAVPAPSTPD